MGQRNLASGRRLKILSYFNGHNIRVQYLLKLSFVIYDDFSTLNTLSPPAVQLEHACERHEDVPGDSAATLNPKPLNPIPILPSTASVGLRQPNR